MVDLAGIDQAVALVLADLDSSELVALDHNPAIGSVSRWAQVFFSQSWLRPELYLLSRTFETTPSSPSEQACWYISRPSTSKFR